MAIGCHARHQPARQEKLGVRRLAQGHFDTPTLRLPDNWSYHLWKCHQCLFKYLGTYWCSWSHQSYCYDLCFCPVYLSRYPLVYLSCLLFVLSGHYVTVTSGLCLCLLSVCASRVCICAHYCRISCQLFMISYLHSLIASPGCVIFWSTPSLSSAQCFRSLPFPGSCLLHI